MSKSHEDCVGPGGRPGPMTEHQSVQYKINDKINYKSRPSSQSAEAQKPPSINKRHNGPVGGRRALICTLCSLLAGDNTTGINMEESDESSGFNFECLVK